MKPLQWIPRSVSEHSKGSSSVKDRQNPRYVREGGAEKEGVDEGWVNYQLEDPDLEEDSNDQSSIGSMEVDQLSKADLAATLHLGTLFSEDTGEGYRLDRLIHQENKGGEGNDNLALEVPVPKLDNGREFSKELSMTSLKQRRNIARRDEQLGAERDYCITKETGSSTPQIRAKELADNHTFQDPIASNSSASSPLQINQGVSS
ncbi:PREDICTED: uncharacterized protein LOC104609766 isoform X1 [Nelumbo nucifera]|uniref:Uncharacterized protein LOC104609766 isoform X1 n=1 Tax=Nelumbo nucifera TaxID=4432 RepID=A0A1U8Q2J0_NELNU|nr:PREDICTED: uncharacterized protein LOC104609766 isoform X1 [Nelumbo nucifera]